MKPAIRSRIILASLLACLSFAAITLVICWCEAQLTIARASELGLPPPMYYVETIVGGTVTFFLVILVLLKLVKVRLGAGVVVLALGLSMVCRVASGIALPFIGAHPSEHFLDGFGARVSASGVHANALAWGDQILTDESLNSQGVRLVRLSPDRIPPFFAAAIGSSEPIEAIVYYGKESRQAASVRVQADEGVHWGIWISKETQMNLDLSDPKPRWIAERFHVFISYDK